MSIHTDQATVDRWLADGRWVEFAPGERVLNPTPSGVRQRRDDIEPTPPADWEAAQVCETCRVAREHGEFDGSDWRCPDCDNTGKRRHPVTVPCDHKGSEYLTNIHDGQQRIVCCNLCKSSSPLGRITVAWATVEWGPARVVATPSDSPDEPCVTILPRGVIGYWSRDGRPVQVPPVDLYVNAYTRDIDPQSLVGQWARGGTIEAAS